METVSDPSMRGFLVMGIAALGLYAGYLAVVFFSNQASRRLAARTRRTSSISEPARRGGWLLTRARTIIFVLIATLCGLGGVLLWMTRVPR